MTIRIIINPIIVNCIQKYTQDLKNHGGRRFFC
jgi:hypothetical protein